MGYAVCNKKLANIVLDTSMLSPTNRIGSLSIGVPSSNETKLVHKGTRTSQTEISFKVNLFRVPGITWLYKRGLNI